MKRAGHALGIGVLLLAGAGVLMVGGAGIAHAQPASTSVCKKLIATLNSLNANFKTYSKTPKQSAAYISSQLTQATSGGSPAVKSAAHIYVTDFQAAVAANDFNTARLNSDAVVLATTACKSAAAPAAAPATGAPATGGGSTVGLQDPVLFGVGGAAVLVGVVVVGLGLRSRPRTAHARLDA